MDDDCYFRQSAIHTLSQNLFSCNPSLSVVESRFRSVALLSALELLVPRTRLSDCQHGRLSAVLQELAAVVLLLDYGLFFAIRPFSKLLSS